LCVELCGAGYVQVQTERCLAILSCPESYLFGMKPIVEVIRLLTLKRT